MENNKEYSKLNFTTNNNFDILLIKHCNIETIEWKNSNYLNDLLNLDIYKIITTNSNNFLNDLAENLNVNEYNEFRNLQIYTQIIAEFPEYIYELMYFVCFNKQNKIIKDDTLINGVGTLLNLTEEKIQYNCILLKSFVPINKKNIETVNVEKNDIKLILENRVDTTIVIYDIDEWKEIKVCGNLEDFAKHFFDNTFKKLEIPFLMHNINIWYDDLKITNNNNICGSLIKNPIYKCIWFTMLTNEYRGSITLDEVNKIIKVSNKLDSPYQPKNEWIEDEFDENKKQIIKNKYRVLESANNFFT